MAENTSFSIRSFIPETISENQAKDTGMAMVLICLLVAFFVKIQLMLGISIILLIINMTWPTAFKPVAKIWLTLSHLLGSVMSKVILTIIFFILVLPIGFMRRLLGKDPMQLQKWKKDQTSAFKTREHVYTAKDIEHPY
jgi:hypothetical protein